MADADKNKQNPLPIEDWVQEVIKSELLPKPPEGVAVLWGYLGDAKYYPPSGGSSEDPTTKRESYRLYTTPLLNEYIEVRHEDILYSLQLSDSSGPLAGTILWVKPNTTVQHVRAETVQIRAGFLQGPITGGGFGAAQPYASPAYGQPGPMGGLTFGVYCPPTTGGLTFPCGGGGLTFGGICPPTTGGLTFPCGGGGVSFLPGCR
ncbi:MAG TPA: hypothetical protein VEX13_16620 [Chloroflexia bacterium]|nr:hypothetical protein [Chloroflexia bacterium]